MKYNAEVDSEKRNKSPRNDLLRNRKCVGIIQAAKAHTQARLRFDNDQVGCVLMPDPVSAGRWVKRAERSGRSAAGLKQPGD